MTDVKLVRFAAVLVVLAGYAFVFRAGEERLAARTALNAELAERLAGGERLLATRPKLDAERTRLRSRLASRDVRADRSGEVSGFLREAAAVASSRHTAITTVTAASTAASAPHELETTAFDVIVEGRYADVLSLTRALSNVPRALASVRIASLARKNAAALDTTLTASLRVVLHRAVEASSRTEATQITRPRGVDAHTGSV